MVARVTEASGSLAPTQRPGPSERREQMLAASWGAGDSEEPHMKGAGENNLPGWLGAREQVQGSLSLSPFFVVI